MQQDHETVLMQFSVVFVILVDKGAPIGPDWHFANPNQFSVFSKREYDSRV